MQNFSTFLRRSMALTLVLLILCPFVARADLAEEDYQEYANTKYVSAAWNNLVKDGMKAFHEGQYETAHNSLYQAFNKGCESPIVLFMLAAITEYKESYYTALEFYQMTQKGCSNANQHHRFCTTLNENYGRALYNAGKKAEALPLLQKAAKTTKSYWVLKLLGMIAYEQGDTLNALSYLERAVRIMSEDVTREEVVSVYSLLGKLFLLKGEQDGATRYYQKVLELDPNNVEAKKFMSVIQKSYRDQQMMKTMDELKDI